MYCSNCGKEIADDAKYCKYCGYDLTKEQPNIHEDAPSNDATSLEKVKNEDAKEGIIAKKISKRKRLRKQREIEDAMSLDKYTIKDEMVSSADTLPKDRILLKDKGTIASLKTKEIVLICVALLLMIVAACLIAFINSNAKINEDTMSALVVVGYFMFFVVFFALAMGVDRVYNLLTLNELSTRRITLKKYGFKLTPLALKNGHVYSIDILGDCDKCNTEIKGTYHLEWRDEELIAVCNIDRSHIHKIDVQDILDDVQNDVTSEINVDNNSDVDAEKCVNNNIDETAEIKMDNNNASVDINDSYENVQSSESTKI